MCMMFKQSLQVICKQVTFLGWPSGGLFSFSLGVVVLLMLGAVVSVLLAMLVPLGVVVLLMLGAVVSVLLAMLVPLGVVVLLMLGAVVSVLLAMLVPLGVVVLLMLGAVGIKSTCIQQKLLSCLLCACCSRRRLPSPVRLHASSASSCQPMHALFSNPRTLADTSQPGMLFQRRRWALLYSWGKMKNPVL